MLNVIVENKNGKRTQFKKRTARFLFQCFLNCDGMKIFTSYSVIQNVILRLYSNLNDEIS